MHSECGLCRARVRFSAHDRQPRVSIGHHTTIGRSSIQPGANIAGAGSIGEGAYIGMGAIVLDHINVGAHAVVGAGAVVTHDVPDHTQVMGIPARVVKENIEGR
jgi:serine acetyltransferase